MLQLGERVHGTSGEYELVDELGRGGFGITYLARETSSGAEVALKTLRMEQLDDWKSLELFERETAVLRRLDHPRIPRYLDDFPLGTEEAPAGLALVQEYVAGKSLAWHMAHRSQSSQEELLAVMAQLLDVLTYLHGQSPPVIHRDITPKNILVKERGEAFLVDFGAVQDKIRSLDSVSSTSAGTFGYAPMEQFVGKASPSSDLYGLAMTIVAVASGLEPSDMPFDGNRVELREITSFDARLTLLLEAMTKPDPGSRLGNAREALTRIQPLLPLGASHIAERAPSSRRALDAGATPRGSSAELPEAAPLLPLPRPEVGGVDMDDAHISDDGRLVALGHLLVRGDDWSPLPPLEGRIKHGIVRAMDPSGHRLAVMANEDETLQLFVRQDDGTYAVDGTFTMPFCGRQLNALALNPDGSTMAVEVTNQGMDLFDMRSGAKLQTLHEEHNLDRFGFGPDGGVLVMAFCGKVTLMLRDGREHVIEADDLIFSPDGKTAAIMEFERVRFGVLRDDLRLEETGRVALPGVNGYKHPRFSPSGDYLAVSHYAPDILYIIDVRGQRVVSKSGDPVVPRDGVRCVMATGFSPDSSRVFVAAEIRPTAFFERQIPCVSVWSVDGGGYLGAVYPWDRTVALHTVHGLYGMVPNEHAPSRKKRGKGQHGSGAGGTPDVWCQPEAARAYLSGRPVEEVLPDDMRAGFASYGAAWRRLERAKQQKDLDETVPLVTAMEVVLPVAHLVELVLDRAKRIRDETPRFGGKGAPPPPTLDHLQRAASELAAMGRDEQAVLWEELQAKKTRAETERKEREARKTAEKKRKRKEAEAKRLAKQERKEAAAAEVARKARRAKIIAGSVVGGIFLVLIIIGLILAF